MNPHETNNFKRHRSRAVAAILLAAGGVHVSLLLLLATFGIANPQWVTLPIGLSLWTLAFAYAFRMPVSVS